MTQIRAWIRKRPLLSFYVIAFAFTWGLGFSYIAWYKNELFLLLPLTFVATSAPALAGIIVSAVEGGQERPKFGRNRARWIVFFVALFVCTAILLANLHFFDGVPLSPILAIFAFFLLTPPVAFIVSAAYSRGVPVRAMMASLVRLRGVAGWALLALVFVPGLALLAVAMADLLGRQPASAASSVVLGAPLLGLIAIKCAHVWFFIARLAVKVMFGCAKGCAGIFLVQKVTRRPRHAAGSETILIEKISRSGANYTETHRASAEIHRGKRGISVFLRENLRGSLCHL